MGRSFAREWAKLGHEPVPRRFAAAALGLAEAVEACHRNLLLWGGKPEFLERVRKQQRWWAEAKAVLLREYAASRRRGPAKRRRSARASRAKEV